MINREKVVEGLNALLKAMYENQCYACSHEFIEVTQEFGTNIIEDTLELLKEQGAIIEQYHRADGFLAAHGWKWESR